MVICEDRQKATVPSLNCPLISRWSRALLRPITVSCFPARCNSVDITIHTLPGLPTPEQPPNLRSSNREVPSTDQRKTSTPVCCPVAVQLVSAASIQTLQATPLNSVNTPVFRCIIPSQVTPGQVTPVTSVNAPEFSPLQTTEALALIPSSPSANKVANIHEFNNGFKAVDCTTALGDDVNSSSKDLVSTLLSANPALQVALLSCPFQPLWEHMAHTSAFCRPPRHPPDHVTTTLGIPVTSSTEQLPHASAIPRPVSTRLTT